MTLQPVFKTKNIIKVGPDDSLSHVFSLFSSSHDSAFVFDEKNHFLGAINPYHCVIKKSYPANTKVKHCLIHPPYIDINCPLKKVARYILDSRLYYLPVFSNKNFVGIISARRLLEAVKDLEGFNSPAGSFLKYKSPLVSVFEQDFLSKALALFKQYKVSKLVVLTKDLKLRGIISYFDLIAYLLVPREKQHFSSREGNKIPFLKRSVTTAMKNNVVTISIYEKLHQAAAAILNKQVGSVVVVDESRHPLGLITIHDLLSIYIGRRGLFNAELVTKDLSEKSLRVVSRFVDQLNRQLSRIKNLSRARVFIKEKTKGSLFDAVVSLFLNNRTVKVIKKQGKNLIELLSDIKKTSKNS